MDHRKTVKLNALNDFDNCVIDGINLSAESPKAIKTVISFCSLTPIIGSIMTKITRTKIINSSKIGLGNEFKFSFIKLEYSMSAAFKNSLKKNFFFFKFYFIKELDPS